LDAGLTLLVGLAEPLDAGFALEAGALGAFAEPALGFDLAATVLGFDSPVTAFLAAGFFALLAFLATGFLTAVFLPLAVVFDFFAVEVYFLVEAVVALVAVDFDTAFGLADVVEAFAFSGLLAAVDFFTVVAFLEVVDLALVIAGFLVAGFVFSLAASLFPFPASLTLPEGPFGRTNVPFSAPCAIALLS